MQAIALSNPLLEGETVLCPSVCLFFSTVQTYSNVKQTLRLSLTHKKYQPSKKIKKPRQEHHNAVPSMGTLRWLKI